MIEVKNLTMKYRRYKRGSGLLNLFRREYETNTALDGISFKVQEGEFLGLVGPNGAGKSTTLKILSGILKPTSGEVNVMGFMPFKKEKDFLKQITFLPTNKNQLWWDVPPMDTFLLLKDIYGIDNKAFKEQLEILVELMNVGDLIHVQTRRLSFGERMKCEIIASLIHRPKLIIMDEPTLGLDIVSQRNIRDFLREYNNKMRATIILTSHYMHDIENLCSRILLLNKGKIIYDGSKEGLTVQSNMRFVRVTSLNFASLKKLRSKIEGLAVNIEESEGSLDITVLKDNLGILLNDISSVVDIYDLTVQKPYLENILLDIFDQTAGGIGS